MRASQLAECVTARFQHAYSFGLPAALSFFYFLFLGLYITLRAEIKMAGLPVKGSWTVKIDNSKKDDEELHFSTSFNKRTTGGRWRDRCVAFLISSAY